MAYKTSGKPLPRPLNQQHVRRCCNFSFVRNPTDLIRAKSDSENLSSSVVKLLLGSDHLLLRIQVG